MDEFPDDHNTLNLISMSSENSDTKVQDNLIQQFAGTTSVLPTVIDTSVGSDLLHTEVSGDPNLLQIESSSDSTLLHTEESPSESNLLQSVVPDETGLLNTAVDSERSMSSHENAGTDLFSMQGVSDSGEGDLNNHACVNFQEKLYQYLGDGGQVFQSTGYECMQCSQLYTASQLQELAADRQQKPQRQTIDCLPPSLEEDPSSSTLDLDLNVHSITQSQHQHIENIPEVSSIEPSLISVVTSNVNSQDSQAPVIMDSPMEEIVSRESNETKFLIGQPRVAGLMQYPQVFSDSVSDVNINELEKQLRSPVIASSNQTQKNQTSLVFTDHGEKNNLSTMTEMTFQISDINHFIQDSEYREGKDDGFNVQANDETSEQIQSKQLEIVDYVHSDDNQGGHSNLVVTTEGVDNVDDNTGLNSAETSDSYVVNETVKTEVHDNIVVTFAQDKPPAVAAESNIAQVPIINVRETNSVDITETDSGNNITRNQQRALDRLISELENVTKNNDSQHTQVLNIDELMREEQNGDNDKQTAVETEIHHYDSEQTHMNESNSEVESGVDYDVGVNDETTDSDDGGLDILTDDAEEDTPGNLVDNTAMENVGQSEDQGVNLQTRTTMNQVFDAVDNANSYTSLYEQVEKKARTEITEMQSHKISKFDLSDNVETDANLIAAKKSIPIGRMIHVSNKAMLHGTSNTDSSKMLTLFQCSHCKVAFTSKNSLEIHYKNVHAEGMSVSQNMQESSFAPPPSKRNKSGAGMVQIDGENIYICKCKARFKTIEDLEVHLDTDDHSTYKCPDCDREFDSYQALNAHMVSHTSKYVDKMNNKTPTILIPVEPYIPSAENSSDSKQSVAAVRKLFSGGVVENVSVSEVTTGLVSHGVQDSQHEQAHTIVEHSQYLEGPAEVVTTQANIKQEYLEGELTISCEPSTSAASTSYQPLPDHPDFSTHMKEVSDAVILGDHSLLVNQEVLKGVDSAKGKFQMEKDIVSITCIRCNKSYSCAEKWTYTGTLQCSACRWNFESPPHLQCHFDHFHRYDRECPLCSFKTNRCSSSIMDKHFKTAHSTKEIFHCYLCEATFTTRACLRNHVARHFSQTGNYECPHCHMRFEKDARLNIHKVRNHSKLLSIPKGVQTPEQSTLYMCGICGRQYEYEGTLRMHLRKHQVNNTSTIIEQMETENTT